jgi:thymidylate synthase (FAD)
MTISIVSVTQPEPELNMTAEELVIYNARVSNPAGQHNHWSAPKLIYHLIREKHWSPFDMVDVTMEVTTTRDISRQMIRHRSFAVQEFSQRYADPTTALGFSTREPRLQDTKNRQNSIELEKTEATRELREQWYARLQAVINYARFTYDWGLQRGIAKEQLRAVLPEGLTLSRLYFKGSLRSWMHYCQVRMHPSTQKEHREIAVAAWALLETKFPVIIPACNVRFAKEKAFEEEYWND